MKFQSVLNLPFGDWTVIEEKERGINRRVKCRCKCCLERMIIVSALRSGHSTGCLSCGKFESVLGRTFYYLTVTAEPETGRHRKVLCDCVCGRRNILRKLHSMKTGDTKSCGCMKNYEFHEFGFIYYLLDPISMKICYVGQTVIDPNRRLSDHIHDSKYNKQKRNWIQSLYPYRPQLIVVERNIPIAKLMERENFHIEQCLRRKQPLLNIMLPSKIAA